jgi:hypothetical protein
VAAEAIFREEWLNGRAKFRRRGLGADHLGANQGREHERENEYGPNRNLASILQRIG